MIVNVFDFIENKYIAKGISTIKAAELIGTTYKYISFAKVRGSLIKGRYRIEGAGIIVKMEYEEAHISYVDDFKERWDDTMKAAHMIRNGTGKIKTVGFKGKYKKITVHI